MTDHMLMGSLADGITAPNKRMSNSTYLALACANAVSQGSMTRKFRAMFEQQPAKEPPALMSRAEVKQAIQESRMRRNSIASSIGSPSVEPQVISTQSSNVGTDPTTPTKPAQQPNYTAGRGLRGCISPGDNVARHFKNLVSPAQDVSPPSTPPRPKNPYAGPPRPASVAGGEIRCDKCSSILPSPSVSPVPPAQAPLKKFQPSPPPQTTHRALPIEPVEEEEEKKLAVVPANREVNEEELPKPDTVKNARCLFESSLVGLDGYSTLQHVKSNPSSKILRSESTMTLDRAGSRHQQFRWPARSEAGSIRHRSPSPSLSTSPLPTAPFKTSKSSVGPAFYYRSTPSLYQNRPPPQQRPAGQHNVRHSRHSTDVESYVSESECWSSDLESEAGSYGTGSHSSAGHHDQTDMDGMRYISPRVMEKIRSYGMTLTFVNGKMVDEDADEDDDDDVDEQAGRNYKATQKVVQSIRSAGQSKPTTKAAPAVVQQTASAPTSPVKKVGPKVAPKVAPKQQTQPARIVACVPKMTSEKKRHSSGESSASSGVSSADSYAGKSSSSPSPFASLKRTAASTAIHKQQGHDEERCPSPDLISKDARKSQGTSPFGSYSVVFEFSGNSAANNNGRNHHRSPMYV